MLKTSLKNFAKNLLLLFVPMGLFYLFLLIALFAFVGASASDLSVAITKMGELIGNSADQSSASVTDFLSYAFAQINWTGNPVETIATIVNTRWIQNTVSGFFATLNQSSEGFEADFNQIVGNFVDKIVADFTVAVVTVVLGVILANYAMRFVLRRRTAKRNLKKFVIAHTLVPIVQSTLLIASLVLLSVLKLYSLPLLIVLLAILGAISISSAWLIHRDGTLKLKEVLTFKNVLQSMGVLALIALINIVVAVVLFAVNALFALLLTIPLVIYSANILDVNTESYVCSLIEQKTAKPQTAE